MIWSDKLFVALINRSYHVFVFSRAVARSPHLFLISRACPDAKTGTFSLPALPYLYVNGATKQINVVVSPVPGSAVTLQPSATGITFNTLSWTSLSLATQALTLRATSGLSLLPFLFRFLTRNVFAKGSGSVSVSFAVSGTDQLGYNVPASRSVTVYPTGQR